VGWTGAAANQRGNARSKGMVNLLRANKMDVCIDSTGRDYFALSGDNFRPGADDNCYSRLDIGVTGFAYRRNPSFLYSDVSFYDPGVIHDHGIRNYRINCLLAGTLGLPHSIADHFSAAEFDFFSIDREIMFDFDEKLGIGQSDSVTNGGAKHFCIGLPGDFHLKLVPKAWRTGAEISQALWLVRFSG
jgi:hypothetical protein